DLFDPTNPTLIRASVNPHFKPNSFLSLTCNSLYAYQFYLRVMSALNLGPVNTNPIGPAGAIFSSSKAE
ncbi:MAG: hypothetical protein AB2689_03490, partial [Candidatus Thiodiazotropha taylori]